MKALPLRTATVAPILFAALLAAGCSGKEAPPAPAADAGAALAEAHGGEAAAPAVPSIRGTVLETMDAAGYTYLKLKTAEGETWAAVNESKVAVGDEVSLYAHVVSSGRTSIRVHVEAWKRARTHPTNASVRVTQGVFTYVAIDQDRKPRPLPGRD